MRPDHQDGAEFDFREVASELRDWAEWLRDESARWPPLDYSQARPSVAEVSRDRWQSVWQRVMVPAGGLIRQAFSHGGFQADGRLRRLLANWPRRPRRWDLREVQPMLRRGNYPAGRHRWKRLAWDVREPAWEPYLDARGFERVVALRLRVGRRPRPRDFLGRVDLFADVLEYLADELIRDPAAVGPPTKPIPRRLRKRLRKDAVGKARVGRSRRRIVPPFRADDYLEE